MASSDMTRKLTCRKYMHEILVAAHPSAQKRSSLRGGRGPIRKSHLFPPRSFKKESKEIQLAKYSTEEKNKKTQKPQDPWPPNRHNR